MNRRRFLGGVRAAGMLLGLSGCGGLQIDLCDCDDSACGGVKKSRIKLQSPQAVVEETIANSTVTNPED